MLDRNRVSLQRIEIDFQVDVVSTRQENVQGIAIIIEQTFSSSS